MKVHYINILLFALPLNILVYNQRNHKSTTHHTPKIPTTRLLCECELYAPANYDNDLEMKAVMENFDRQTSERFKEYDERMKTTRQKCKDKCDKEIQKIILKDKIEKELTEKFATLHTDIQSDAIPTCVCEKSLADKTEKFCLNCGKTMGGVTPGWGLIGGLMYEGWTNYAATTLVKIATDAGISEGVKAGLANVAKIVTEVSKGAAKIPAIDGAKLITLGNFSDGVSLDGVFKTIDTTMYAQLNEGQYAEYSMWVQRLAGNHKLYSASYSTQIAEVTNAFSDTKAGILADGVIKTNSLTTGITASVVVIVIIVLIMVIIYLVLRYRRKKKMKKKQQYIKLLEE
ncbi:rifin PIR protein, putative [Plasmodium reichenowi]|uniref:Rifin PIR protein, putative n=1 Tax=Plasmodium reichenowi TaxID=5854 RepID=A0A2P9DSC4_PLARE|nr:rifin PIR protein, putative [Plasmodium reichenowi]